MKSKLLMLIISSFVFVGCTIDTKQNYSMEARVNDRYSHQVYVLNNKTGEISLCEARKDNLIHAASFVCSKPVKTHK